MEMNMSEVARLIFGLREKGWSEKEINDFLIYIETGIQADNAQKKE